MPLNYPGNEDNYPTNVRIEQNGDPANETIFQPSGRDNADRTAWLKKRLQPLIDAIGYSLARLVIQHATEIAIQSPIVDIETIGTPSGGIGTFRVEPDISTGRVRLDIPIMGGGYSSHGSVDLDVYQGGLAPNPVNMGRTAYTTIIVDAANLTSTTNVRAPGAPATWAQAYTVCVYNPTRRTIAWWGSSTGEVLLPYERAIYLRGPGTLDWYKISSSRGKRKTYKIEATATAAITAVTYTELLTLTIPNVQLGDEIDVTAFSSRDAGGPGYLRLEVTGSATPNTARPGPSAGAGPVYDTFEVGQSSWSGVPHMVNWESTVNGTVYLHLQAAKTAGGDAAHNHYNRRMIARHFANT